MPIEKLSFEQDFDTRSYCSDISLDNFNISFHRLSLFDYFKVQSGVMMVVSPLNVLNN